MPASLVSRWQRGGDLEEYGSDSFACANLCGKGKTCNAPDREVLSYCEMDPFNHATGWEISNWSGQESNAAASAPPDLLVHGGTQ